MKVYELAQKLEVKSVFLMDKIRKDWKLPIKNHMELLNPQQVEDIEKKFVEFKKSLKKATVKKTTTKKSTVKKKLVTKSTVKKKLVTKKLVTKKLVTKSTVKKKLVKKATVKKNTVQASANKILKEPEAPNDQALKTVKRKFIIRRKKDEKPDVALPPVENKLINTNSDSEKDIPSRASKDIRLDLVSVKTTNLLDEEFWNTDAKKQEEEQAKKVVKKPISEKNISSKFNATDFRKRETIFQPRKKRIAQAGEFKSTTITTPQAHKRIVKIHGETSLENLCQKMGIKKYQALKKLKEKDFDINTLKVLDFDTISLIAPIFNFEAVNTKQTQQGLLNTISKDLGDKILKPPVVTIMGHVDHGKTTLLDTIRKTKIVNSEAGGITQHIGAYSVVINKKHITFIDTPGHEAFTSMRARGVQVTDIVVIVVAASDGIMPQSLEALNHAKQAKIPIIIAVNKIDLPNANIDKIKKQLSEHDVVAEDWGGDTSFMPISALKGTGIKELLEQIHLVAEMQELKCQPKNPAKGVVLESHKSKGLGSVISLIIQDGTLKQGDHAVVGMCSGRVRQIKNDQGQVMKQQGPGHVVEVVGFTESPNAGDLFYAVKNEKQAKTFINVKKELNQKSLEQKVLSPEDMLLKMTNDQNKKKELNIILKTDVHGSLEACKSSLEKIITDEVVLKIVHSGTGAITKNDVLLASTVKGIILGFNVRPDIDTVKQAKQKSINIYTHSVIYELLDQVKTICLGMFDVEFETEEQGQIEVRQIFHISKVGTVAGCYVTSGNITRNCFVRLVRDGRLIYEGKLSSLKRFKEDIKQAGTGFECGLSLENFNDIKPKDILESYIKKEKQKTKLNSLQ